MMIYDIKLQDSFIEEFEERTEMLPNYIEFIIIANTVEDAIKMCHEEEISIDDSKEFQNIWKMENVICRLLGISKEQPQIVTAVAISFEG